MTMQNRDYLPLLNSGLNDSSGSSARPSGPLTPNAGRTATETNTLGQVPLADFLASLGTASPIIELPIR